MPPMHLHVSHEGRPSKVLRRRRFEHEPESGVPSTFQSSPNDLCSVLRSIPLPDAVALVWNYLPPAERRALRGTCRELRQLCNSCVANTTCMLAGSVPARAQVARCEQQLLCFPRLQKLELRRAERCRSNPARLFTLPSLKSMWNNLQELKLFGFTGPGPALKLPRAFGRLKLLALHAVELDGGALSSLATVTTLTSFTLKQVAFRRNTVVHEIGAIRTLTCLEMDECVCQGFYLDMMAFVGLDKLESLDVTHVDKMTGGSVWRQALGAVLSPLTSLRSVRLDASEYGVVVETEEQLPHDMQLAYNRALSPITALQRLESLAMDFLLTDDGWRAASQLPLLRELIVEGVSLSEPMPGIMTSLEELTLNKVTPSQLVKLLPLPRARRIHIIFINVTANSMEELDALADNLQQCSELLIAPVIQRRQAQQQQLQLTGQQAAADPTLGASSSSADVLQDDALQQALATLPSLSGAAASGFTGLGQSQHLLGPSASVGGVPVGAVPLVQAGHPSVLLPAAIAQQAGMPSADGAVQQGAVEMSLQQSILHRSQQAQQHPNGLPGCDLELWAGLQLVAENTLDNGNEQVMYMSKQIGSGRLARALQPIAPVLRTLCFQCMAVTCADINHVFDSLPHLGELVLMSCSLEPLVLQQMHRVDRSFSRLSLLYGCSWITAAQVSAYCIAAASARILAAARRLPLSPVLELEISSDSMPWDEQLEAQRVLQPYTDVLAQGRVRLMFVADRDLTSAAAAAVGGAAGANVDGQAVGGLAVGAGAPPPVVIGAQEPLPLMPAPGMQ